ncbi:MULTISPECIES: YjcZ family sporulation protein [Gottfriedia]|nr:YjcZ family sporulation protein [Gottfriedia solisilvae]
MSKGGNVSPGYGHGNGFALIVVLFILLIIVGCAFIC